MLEFDLYRVKLLEPPQRKLFSDELSRQDLLKSTIASIPQEQLREGHIWMLGDVEEIDEWACYLRIGRITKRALEIYSNGKFTETEFETSPYTHAVVDYKLEICAIAQKATLSPTTRTIANSLAKLLERSKANQDHGVDFELDPIKDPDTFLAALGSAYEVRSFSFTFSRPNPFDANTLVIKPLQETLREARGTSGEVKLQGTELDSSTLQDITRSVAASGDDASARIRAEKDAKPTLKKLSGNLARVGEERLDSREEKEDLLRKVRSAYEAIRSGGTGEASFEGE